MELLPEQEARCSYCSDGGSVTSECRRKLRARGGAAANDGGASLFDGGGDLLAANLLVGDDEHRSTEVQGCCSRDVHRH